MWLCTLPSESSPMKCSGSPLALTRAVALPHASPRNIAPDAMAAFTSFAP